MQTLSERIEAMVADEARRQGVPALTLEFPKVGDPHAYTEVVIKLQGWSPTLNRQLQVLSFDVLDFGEVQYRWDSDEEEQAGLDAIRLRDPGMTAKLILYYLKPHFEEQLERKQAGSAIGIHEPMPLENVDHVRVDGWIHAALCAKDVDVETVVRCAVKAVGDDVFGFSVSVPVCGENRNVQAELIEDDDNHPLPMALIELPVKDRVTFDGHSLSVHGVELPQSVMDNLEGRRLGDVIEIDPTLDDRIISDADRWVEMVGTQTKGKIAPMALPIGDSVPVLKIWLKPDPVNIKESEV